MDGLDYEPDATAPPRSRRGDRRLLGLLLIGLGTVWFLSESNVLALSAETVLSGLLILLALGLIYSARWGRRMDRWPILMGIGLTVALVANSPSLHFPSVRGGVGDQPFAPQSVEELRPAYRAGIGNLRLDLTSISPADLEDRHIDLRMGGGNVEVIVPSGVAVDVSGRVRVGQFMACGQDLSTGFTDTEQHFDSDPKAKSHLWLMINSGIGSVDVQGCEQASIPTTPATATTPVGGTPPTPATPAPPSTS